MGGDHPPPENRRARRVLRRPNCQPFFQSCTWKCPTLSDQAGRRTKEARAGQAVRGRTGAVRGGKRCAMCRCAAVAVLLLAVGRATGAAVTHAHALRAGPQRLRGGFEAAMPLKPANLGRANAWSGQNVGESAAPAAAREANGPACVHAGHSRASRGARKELGETRKYHGRVGRIAGKLSGL